MNNDYQAIVIGAGNGGLMTAATLAKQGIKTLMIDKHNIPGGSASSIHRGRFEFEPSLHELSNVGYDANDPNCFVRGLFAQLGADVDWCVEHTELYHLVIPEEGIDFSLSSNPEKLIMDLEKEAPGSAGPMMQMLQLGQEAAAAYAYISSKDFDPDKLDELYPHAKTMAGHSIKEVLTAIGMPERAQAIVSQYWCYLGATATEMDALTYFRMFVSYLAFGAGMPRLRSHELSLALEKVVRDNGGEVWYNTPADKILVKDGKAYGVRIGGKDYYADNIICNAYPEFAYSYLIDKEEVPEKSVKLVNARESAMNLFTVYLGMNKSDEELGLKHYTNFIMKTSDTDEQARLSSMDRANTSAVILNDLNKLVPDCTPEGTCFLFLTGFSFGHAWDSITPEEHQKEKERAAEVMIRRCEEALGIEIMPYIEEIEIASPVTFARFLGTPNGTPYGYKMNKWDNYIQREVDRDADLKTIDKLDFVGAATRVGDGYSTTYLGGYETAIEISEALKEKGEIQR
ncbi:MAG: NAD(P)/FAD-dependent oxidoreductase [Mogibacterium sp.]|nr:NAD(P)/FAD-dependent oxidoreductase [Mogibacterium sp.]